MDSRFGVISYTVVEAGTFTASNVGFAKNCKTMILVAYPSMPREVFDREDIQKMMREVDNETGSLYVIEPEEGQPLLMNSTLEALRKDYEQHRPNLL